jgi:putative intracellular protease/amidase
VQIAILLFPRMTALDAIGPYEVLQRLPDTQVVFVGKARGEYRTENGRLGLIADATLAEAPRPDVVVVPGGVGTRKLLDDAEVLDWVRNAHEHTRYTTSVCTGSLLLAAAGLLDGVDATTHWSTMDLLGRLGAHPIGERVVERGKVITAAGVSSGIDMALVLAARLTDELTAKAMQLMVEYDPQPPFDAGSLAKAGAAVAERAIELAEKP